MNFCIIVYVVSAEHISEDHKITIWLLGQAVKTPPFHGGNRGSIPLGVTIFIWAHSSAGRAPALQAGGHRVSAEHISEDHKITIWLLGQAVKTPPFHGGNRGSIPLGVTNFGRIAQLGEHLPYKQGVTGSIPVATTIKLLMAQ